jgi:hypothetical protein
VSELFGLPKETILGVLKAAEDQNRLSDAIRYRDELTAYTKRGIHLGDYVECLRWAERVVGVLVRRGQEGPDAWIASRGSNLVYRNETGQVIRTTSGKVNSLEFFRNHNERTEVFKMVDGISDQQFADALERAKAEGSMARQVVIYHLTDIPPDRKGADRPEHLRKTRRVDVKRVIDESISTLHGVFMGLDVLEKEHWDSLSWEDSHHYYNEVDQLVGNLRKFRERVGHVSRSAPRPFGRGQMGSGQSHEGQSSGPA